MKRLTLTEMKQVNKAIGHYYFSKDSMKFWNAHIEAQPNKFNMFIESVQPETNKESMLYTNRTYMIKYCTPQGKIISLTQFGQLSSLEEAKEIRLTIAKGLEEMANRENWIMDNLSEVEFTNDWITFIAYDGDQIASNRRDFDISYDGKICG